MGVYVSVGVHVKVRFYVCVDTSINTYHALQNKEQYLGNRPLQTHLCLYVLITYSTHISIIHIFVCIRVFEFLCNCVYILECTVNIHICIYKCIQREKEREVCQ